MFRVKRISCVCTDLTSTAISSRHVHVYYVSIQSARENRISLCSHFDGLNYFLRARANMDPVIRNFQSGFITRPDVLYGSVCNHCHHISYSNLEQIHNALRLLPKIGNLELHLRLGVALAVLKILEFSYIKQDSVS